MENKNTKKKNQKGFYTALAISTLMVVTACIWSYSNAEELESAEITTETEEIAANNYQEDIPKLVETEEETDSTECETEIETEPVIYQEEAVLSVEVETEAVHRICFPLDGELEVVKEFSNGELVKSETTGSWQTHNGTDYKATKGDNVYAVDSGVVTFVGEEGLMGTVIEIDHENGYVTRYCGVGTDISVSVNDNVEAGERIAVVGDNPEFESEMELHFHFEVKKDGSYIDPKGFLEA